MIIHLRHKLFSENPDIRFSRWTGLREGTLNDLWHRYKYHDFEREDMLDWIKMKNKRNIHVRTLNRWVLRMKIFYMSQQLIKKGVCEINTSYFSPYEKFVINEITPNWQKYKEVYYKGYYSNRYKQKCSRPKKNFRSLKLTENSSP